MKYRVTYKDYTQEQWDHYPTPEEIKSLREQGTIILNVVEEDHQVEEETER